jgi:hypothetical protein
MQRVGWCAPNAIGGLYDVFKECSVVAVGWHELGSLLAAMMQLQPT